MTTKVTRKTSILFNQLWICKAIEDGNYNFLPSKIIPGMSIGEFIETRYESLDSDKKKSPKITKKNSIIFQREWIEKAYEEGIPLPSRRISHNYSIGEILELQFFEREMLREQAERERYKVFQIKIGSE